MAEFIPSPSIKAREQFGELLNLRELTGQAVEIGTHQGEFADSLLATWEGRQLACVDPWETDLPGYDEDCLQHRDRRQDYNMAMERLGRYRDRVLILRMLSEQAVDLFKHNSLDFVYIDGNHNREYVRRDVEMWYPRVRNGGVFAGHDWNGDWKDHVQPVLKDLMAKTGQPIFYVLGDAASWYMIKP